MASALAPYKAGGLKTGVPHPRESFSAQVNQTTEAEWSCLLEQFADANIYQTWAYGAIHWGEKQVNHLVLRHNDAPVALAQLRVVRVPILGSGIAYVRWGPVCTPEGSTWNPAVWRAMTEALIEEYVRRRGMVLRVIPNTFRQDPEAAAIGESMSELGLVKEGTVRDYQTLRIDLRPSVEALRQQLSSRWRRQLSLAERNRLEVVEGRSDDLYQQFLSLYREMIARKQFDTSVDVNDFRRVQRRLPESQKMMVLICLAEGRAAAGLVVATVGRTAIYLLAATGDSGLRVRGSYLLQWHAMQRLKELGHEWYDLGGVNQEMNPGVFTFKSGMGSEPAYQLGCYQLCCTRLSDWSVSLGEGIQRIARKVRRAG